MRQSKSMWRLPARKIDADDRRTQRGFIISFAGTAMAFYTHTFPNGAGHMAGKRGLIDKKLLNNPKLMEWRRFQASVCRQSIETATLGRKRVSQKKSHQDKLHESLTPLSVSPRGLITRLTKRLQFSVRK
jgi:hypothetical protein